MLSTLIAQTEEELAPLVAEPWVFAAIAALIFIALGFITWSYRDVSHRHADKAANDAHGHGHSQH